MILQLVRLGIVNIISYRFLHSLRWGAIESTVYQMLFVGHHAALFAICPATIYGTAGILFSAFFMIVNLCNLGLDPLLAPHITAWSQSKESFVKFFTYHLIPTYALLAGFLSFATLWIDSSLVLQWPIIITALLVESFRKTLRTLLRLVGYNREVALVEIMTFLCYGSLVWGWYWFTGVFSVHILFTPLLIAGLLSTLVLLLYTQRWYAALPMSTFKPILLPALSSRVPLVTHQLTNALLSPNILVLICSMKIPVVNIGSIKLITVIIQSMSLILSKTFGTSTAVLYATQKANQLHTVDSWALLRNAYQVPFALLTFLIVSTICGCFLFAAEFPLINLLVMVIGAATSYLVIYEQLFIAHSSTQTIVWPNIATIIILLALSSICPATYVLSIFLVLRLVTIGYLQYQTYYTTSNKRLSTPFEKDKTHDAIVKDYCNDNVISR